MAEIYARTCHNLGFFRKLGTQLGWKKVTSITLIVGAMFGGVSGTAQAVTQTASLELTDVATLAAPQLEQPELGITSGSYFSTHIERDRSTGPLPIRSGAVVAAVAATRCPAFVSWEDFGGAWVHAYVDFRPSDLCNGRHVKVAYVRLIRQCGPFFDTGRIYTYTAGSASDTRLYSVSASILDSLLWWCNTNTYYGYDYF